MKIVVIGCGTQGRFVALEMCNQGHDVTVVDTDFTIEELWSTAAMENLNLSIVIGDGCDLKTLTKAKCDEADVLFSCTGDDEDNLVASLLAKQEFGVSRVIARVNHPNNEWLFNEHWGIDKAVSPPHLLSSLIHEEVTRDKLIELLSFDDGRVELVELTLSNKSPLIDKRLEEISFPRQCSLVAILRDGHVIFPQPSTHLEIEDEMIILATKSVVDELYQILNAT